MNKCERCLNRVPVISENGMHYNCSLSEKASLKCLINQKDHSVIIHDINKKQ